MNEAIDDIDLKLFTEAVFLKYGYDFRSYAEASLRRRLSAVMAKLKVDTLPELQHVLLRDSGQFSSMVRDVTVTTTEMFRDPCFFKALRHEVVPILKTYPAIKVWHAGCSTGEEVYSLAILLREEGLYDRATIYATDLNPSALQTARDGIYPTEAVKIFTTNYYDSGGSRNFCDYYTASFGRTRFDPSLRANIVFAEHNLATDDVFSEVQIILCRNVMIYFKHELQARVLDLFARSLCRKGLLCLGSKETVRFSAAPSLFEASPWGASIFRLAPPQVPPANSREPSQRARRRINDNLE